MGASLALAGVTACTRQPAEKIVPYVRQPEELIPGKPLFFATAMPLGGVGDRAAGRKPRRAADEDRRQPAAPEQPRRDRRLRAGRDPRPLRSRSLADADQPRRDSSVVGVSRRDPRGADGAAAAQGRRPPHPDRVGQLADARRRRSASCSRASRPRNGISGIRPAARTRAPARSWRSAEYVDAQYRFDQADVILSLDADFLGCGPGSLRYAREFAARRRPEAGRSHEPALRVESMPTVHRCSRRPSPAAEAERDRGGSRVRSLARSGRGRWRASSSAPAGVASGARASSRRSRRSGSTAVAKDLQAHRGRSLVIAGDGQPPAVHALAHAMNQALGNVGKTVVYTQPVEAEPVESARSLRDLVADMNAGKVDLLRDRRRQSGLHRAGRSASSPTRWPRSSCASHLSLYDDETSALCQWQIPEAHFLEAWSDARGYDGTVSIVQPLIAPLYGGKSAHEVLAALSDRPERSGLRHRPRVMERACREGRCRPRVAALAARRRRRPPAGALGEAVSRSAALDWHVAPSRSRRKRSQTARGGLEISFRNDPCVLDGRFANNGWLQELPKPITRLTWDNAVLVSPATAERLKGNQCTGVPGRRARPDHQRCRRAQVRGPLGARRAVHRGRPS